MERPIDEVIAERMLAAALHNYHHCLTTRRTDGRLLAMKTWPEMTEEQRAFYTDWAIPQAMQTIWKGR